MSAIEELHCTRPIFVKSGQWESLGMRIGKKRLKDKIEWSCVVAEALLDTHCHECEHSSKAYRYWNLWLVQVFAKCFLIINILNLKILRFLFSELHYLPRHCQSCARPSHCEFSCCQLESLDSWTNHKCIMVRSSLPLGWMQWHWIRLQINYLVKHQPVTVYSSNNIRESVDSLCRIGADTQYMQYLSKNRITSPQIR